MILSDTNIIIYLLQGDKAIADLFDQNSIAISFITELELLSAKAYTKGQEEKIHEILREFAIYEYNNLIKAASITLRRKYNLKLPDAIIAATAFVYKLPLLTSDMHLQE